LRNKPWASALLNAQEVEAVVERAPQDENNNIPLCKGIGYRDTSHFVSSQYGALHYILRLATCMEPLFVGYPMHIIILDLRLHNIFDGE